MTEIFVNRAHELSAATHPAMQARVGRMNLAASPKSPTHLFDRAINRNCRSFTDAKEILRLGKHLTNPLLAEARHLT